MDYDEIIEFRIIDIMDNSIMYAGKYGEDLFFTKLGDNKWIFSSVVLNLFDLHFDDIDKRRLLIACCIDGNTDFNYKITYLSRVDRSYEMTKKIYNKYLETKDSKYLELLIEEIIKKGGLNEILLIKL